MTSLRTPTTGTASSSTTLSVTKPTGTVAGDLILIFGLAVSVSLGGIGGFSASGNVAGGAYTNAQAYARTADGTEGSSFTITLSGGTTVGCCICAVYAGPASIDPTSIPGITLVNGPSSAITVPSITLANASNNDWLAWFGGAAYTSTTSLTIAVPAGFTQQASIPIFNNGTDSTGMMFGDIETSQSAGATGAQDGTLSVAARNGGWMVGVNPAASPSGANSAAFLSFF
jgi:hypothetical protein